MQRRLNLRVGANLSGEDASRLIAEYRKTGATVEGWKARPGFVYTQVRAISARVNQNYDGWPSSQLKKYYKTFIGKPVFVNHGNENPKRARGVVIASRYVERGADRYVETIMETDAKRYPKLGKELIKGGLDSVSMGVEAGFTICSVCDNKATDESNMCDHILFHKGEHMKNKKTGKRTLVFEKCFKLGFFELSYVFDPADETAVVSRVISASRDEEPPKFVVSAQGLYRTAGADWAIPSNSDKLQKSMGDGHSLHVYPPHTVEPIFDHGNYDQFAPGGGSERHEWVHTHNGEPINSGFAPTRDQAMHQAEQSHKELAGGWDPESDPFDPRQFGARRKTAAVRGSWVPNTNKDTGEPHPTLNASNPDTVMVGSQKKGASVNGGWYKRADVPRLFKEKAPEDIDTLRDESEDDTDLFHHWVESPPELQAPSMDDTQRADQLQENEGLDDDRNAESAEEYGAPSQSAGPQDPQQQGAPGEQQGLDPGQIQFLNQEEEDDPVMPINPPEFKKSRRNKNRGARMSRYFYADDEDEGYNDPNSEPDDSGSDDGGAFDDGGDDSEDDGSDDSGGGDDIQSLLDEAEADIDAFESGDDDGSDDFGGDDDSGDDDGSWGDDEDDSDGGCEDSGPPEDDGSGDESEGGDQPPWLQEGAYRPVQSARSRRNNRGGTMRTTLASRNPKRRHFTADDGHTDGGPYGIDDSQGNQEEVFISQVPGAEAVVAPTPGDGQISNGEGSLVASRRPQFDPNHYQRLADVVRALPPEQRGAMARKMVAMLSADNKAFNGRTFYEAAAVPVIKRGNRYFYAEELTDPDKVDPGLSGTDVQDLKGDDFESLALDDVETQPKDASIHAFRAFDSWLHQATGRTARQHGNANFIRRAAATYANRWQNPQAKLATLFPTLEFVLHEARKFEGANMQRYAEDESLSVAAPQGRVDVEAPVKNVTDADAQASQFDLGDFAHNAGDQLADPVLDVVDGNSGTWAPDKGKESRKLASGVEAVRLADAYIKAYPNTYSDRDRWTLTARFETLRQPVVRDRIRVLEAVVADNEQRRSKTARKVTAASSRGTNGIPVGLGSRRTAGTRKVSAADPDTDSALFI